MQFSAVFTPDKKSGGFVVTFPDLPECVTQGESVEDASAMAEDALRLCVGEYIRRNKELPAPGTKRRGTHLIALPALDSVKAELYRAFRASGIGKAELARRLGIAKANVDRLFRLDHKSRLDQIEAAFHALAYRLRIEVDAA